MRFLLPLASLLTTGCTASFSDTARWSEYYAGMGWLYNAEEPAIYYGADESDNIAFTFGCAPDTDGGILLTYMSGRKQPARMGDQLVFKAGDQHLKLPAEPENPAGGEVYDHWIYSAWLPAAAFRASAGHRVAVGINRLVESPVEPLPLAMADRLADACAARSA